MEEITKKLLVVAFAFPAGWGLVWGNYRSVLPTCKSMSFRALLIRSHFFALLLVGPALGVHIAVVLCLQREEFLFGDLLGNAGFRRSLRAFPPFWLVTAGVIGIWIVERMKREK